jgi:hypothetical protein
VQQVLEAEMDDTLGAEKGQRSLDRSCVWQLYLAHFGSLIWPTLVC